MTIAQDMQRKLTQAFAPLALEIVDDSAAHAGHAGATRDNGSRGETHFHVMLVSAQFTGMTRVERQRQIYAVLAAELAGPVHALTLKAMAPAEVPAAH